MPEKQDNRIPIYLLDDTDEPTSCKIMYASVFVNDEDQLTLNVEKHPKEKLLKILEDSWSYQAKNEHDETITILYMVENDENAHEIDIVKVGEKIKDSGRAKDCGAIHMVPLIFVGSFTAKIHNDQKYLHTFAPLEDELFYRGIEATENSRSDDSYIFELKKYYYHKDGKRIDVIMILANIVGLDRKSYVYCSKKTNRFLLQTDGENGEQPSRSIGEDSALFSYLAIAEDNQYLMQPVSFEGTYIGLNTSDEITLYDSQHTQFDFLSNLDVEDGITIVETRDGRLSKWTWTET